MPGIELLAPIIAGASSVLTNVFSAREAARNRGFQERMSSTSHQREVRDLKAAGLNPILSARSSGASTPSGSVAPVEDSGGKALATALAVKRQRAEIELIEAQAQKVRIESHQRETLFPQELTLQALDMEMRGMSADQMRKIMPDVLAKAKAEVEATLSSARASRAVAVLNEYAKTGALNEAKFEESVGELGPWGRRLVNLLRMLK